MKKVLILILAVVLSFSVFAMTACQTPCETHVDVNHDGICDVCATEGLTYEHADANHDGACDVCGLTGMTVTHTDSAHDGKCDVCNANVEVNHVDENSDKVCDVCNVLIDHEHVDADNDGNCDYTACEHVYAWVDELAAAKAYVDGLYLNEGEITTDSFTVTTVVSIGGVSYSVAWEIKSDVAGQTVAVLGEIDDKKQQTVVVTYDESNNADVVYKLVGTISDSEGHSVTVEYGRKVPMFATATWEEYVAACEANVKDATITIRAYVIGAVSITSSSKGSLYLQDAEGNGYYAYNPTLDASVTETEEALDAYFPFGTEVLVTGTCTVYNGQYEFNKGCQVVKTGNVAGEGVLTYENVTEVWGTAKNNTDHDVLSADQNKLVVLENVAFTKFVAASGKTQDKYYFAVNGVEFNLYSTNYFMSSEDLATLFAKFETGKLATVKGIVCCYSNEYQIYPIDVEAISNVHANENLTDAEKVTLAKENLTLVENVTEVSEIELPATGELGAAITWAFAEGKSYSFATIADGKLKVTALPTETTAVELVATIKIGDATDTKAIAVNVISASYEIINFAKAVELSGTTKDVYTTDKYYIMGTIKAIDNEKYGNMTLEDEQGNTFYVYGLYSKDGSTSYGSMENKPVVGDLVVVQGILGYYNAPQMKNAWLVSCYKPTTFADATTLAGTEKDVYTTDKYYMTGIVKSVDNDKYGNLTIQDKDGATFTVYGTYSADGSLRYDAMENKPVVGNVVVVYGILGYYNAPQMKDAWILEVAPAGEAAAAHTCESVCATCKGCYDLACEEEACATKCSCTAVHAGTEADPFSVADALLIARNNGTTAPAEQQYVKGFITSATYSEKYGNWELKLADTADGTTTLKGYRVVLDTSITSIKVGDLVTIKGFLYCYNTTAQVQNSGDVNPTVVAVAAAHECETACPACGGCLDAACTEKACETKCACVIVNANDLTAGDITANQVVVENVVTILATESKKVTVDGSKKSIDGFDFTQRIKLGGTIASDARAIKLDLAGPSKIIVYAMSSSSSTDRNLILQDSTGATVGTQVALGASLAKLEYSVTAAGTYLLGSENSGINIYGIIITAVAAEEPVEPSNGGTVEMSVFTATSGNVGEDSNVSYTTAKAGGSSDPAIYNDEIRLYQNSAGTGGGTITISVAEGYKITSITIGSSMGTSVAYTIGDATEKSTTESLAADAKYTVDSLDAQSITFHCMGNSKTTRLYVNYLSVTYAPVEAAE